LGIFLGSFVAGIVGYTVLRSLKAPEENFTEASHRIAEATDD
jgi:hypothetical protein